MIVAPFFCAKRLFPIGVDCMITGLVNRLVSTRFGSFRWKF